MSQRYGVYVNAGRKWHPIYQGLGFDDAQYLASECRAKHRFQTDYRMLTYTMLLNRLGISFDWHLPYNGSLGEAGDALVDGELAKMTKISVYERRLYDLRELLVVQSYHVIAENNAPV